MCSRAIEARKMEVKPVKPSIFFFPFIVTVSFLQRSVIAISLSTYNIEGKKKKRERDLKCHFSLFMFASVSWRVRNIMVFENYVYDCELMVSNIFKYPLVNYLFQRKS